MALALRLVLVWILAALGAAEAQAQEPQVQEHEVKAAFLLKIPAFVEWPQDAAHDHEVRAPGHEVRAPFAIAVVEAPRVASELREMALGRLVDGRTIEVREVPAGEELPGAQVLFIGRAAQGRLAGIARRLAADPVLLVSESPGALEQGAALNFVLSEGRVRFEVSLPAAESRGLRLSARLLALATSVRPARP